MARISLFSSRSKRDRQNVITPCSFFRNQCECGRIDNRVGEIDANLSEAFGQNVAHRGFGNEPQFDQQFAQWDIAFALLDKRNAQLVQADDALIEKDFTEWQLSEECGHRQRLVLKFLYTIANLIRLELTSAQAAKR